MKSKMPILKGSHSLIKDLNKYSILNIIREFGPISRTDIADMLNASIPTVVRAVEMLVADDLVTFSGKGSSSGGRRPPLLEINPSGAYIFGAHIGSSLDIVLSNLKAEIIDDISVPTEMVVDPESTIKQIALNVQLMIEKNNIPVEKVYGVGIGTPGVNFRTNPQIETSAFKGWDNTNINELTQKHIPYKSFLGNIAYTTTLREYWFGHAKGYSDIIHIMVDLGISGGIILNGKPYKGINGKAGEIGHISIQFDGPKCYCGNQGCIETYASIPAIIKRAQSLILDGVPSSLKEKLSSKGSIKFDDICQAADNGDILSQRVLQEAGKKLGAVIANLANVFDPELVVLSGKTVKKSQLLFDTCCTEALERVFSYRDINKHIEIVKGNGTIASPLGSVALVMQSIFENSDVTIQSQ